MCDSPSLGGGVWVELDPETCRNAICPKTTQVLEEATEAAVNLLLALNAAKRVSWRKDNQVLKMATDLLSVLSETRNSIHQEISRALGALGTNLEGPSSGDLASVDNQEQEGAAALPERHVQPEILRGSVVDFWKFENTPCEITGDNLAPSVETFQHLKLDSLLLENVRKCGCSSPTPIQKHVTPQLLAGRDLLCTAPTGSGKTTAFLLPIINQLLNKQDSLAQPNTFPAKPEALILFPKRDFQVSEVETLANLYTNGSQIKTQVLHGYDSISSQKTKLNDGCNILVASTGRLKHFIRAGIVDLSKVRYFILDQADSLLYTGRLGDVMEIVAKLPPSRNSAMFGATLTKEIAEAAKEILNDHVIVSIGDASGACRNVQQEMLDVKDLAKWEKLLSILKEVPKDTKVIIFCAIKQRVNFLTAILTDNHITCTAYHEGRLPSQREKALTDFAVGRRQVLLVTSVAARTLDVPKVGLVVNYNLPSDIDEYIARIGLACGVGHVGRAVSFYDENQDGYLRSSLVSILNGAGQTVPDCLGARNRRISRRGR